jgi:ribosomal protein S18 acetylase RimI-like enzyme
MIRLATPDDIPLVVDIHSQSLSEDYLPRLGKKAVLGYYYTLMKKNPVLLVEEKKCIVGFIALSLYPISLKSVFLKNYKTITIKLLIQPDLWCQTLWLALFSKRHSDNYPEISFIAIKEDYRRAGIGSELVTWACNFLSKKGVEYLKVKTELNNELANNFYKKNGFNAVFVEKRFGRNFNVYLREVKVVNS